MNMKKLTDSSSFKKRMDWLVQRATELGIRVDFTGHKAVAVDTRENKEYNFEYTDGESPIEFPPEFDYSLTYEE